MIESKKKEGSVKKVKVLFVEDDKSIRELIRLVFSKTDFQLDLAENGVEGVSMYKEGNYDLVLMDIKMPVMDGLEASRQIRMLEQKSGRKRTPLIALTAHGTNSDIKKSEEAGCDEHLVKPIKKQELFNIIERYLKDG